MVHKEGVFRGEWWYLSGYGIKYAAVQLFPRLTRRGGGGERRSVINQPKGAGFFYITGRAGENFIPVNAVHMIKQILHRFISRLVPEETTAQFRIPFLQMHDADPQFFLQMHIHFIHNGSRTQTAVPRKFLPQEANVINLRM